jgi:hypothetical protein
VLDEAIAASMAAAVGVIPDELREAHDELFQAALMESIEGLGTYVSISVCVCVFLSLVENGNAVVTRFKNRWRVYTVYTELLCCETQVGWQQYQKSTTDEA